MSDQTRDQPITDHEYQPRLEHGDVCDACEQPEDAHQPACQQPCDPNIGCPDCADYWARMAHEGYWNAEQHRWTNKGWREITKWP